MEVFRKGNILYELKSRMIEEMKVFMNENLQVDFFKTIFTIRCFKIELFQN